MITLLLACAPEPLPTPPRYVEVTPDCPAGGAIALEPMGTLIGVWTCTLHTGLWCEPAAFTTDDSEPPMVLCDEDGGFVRALWAM